MNTLSGQPGNWPAYEIVDIGKLKPAKRNARTHSDPQIDAVADSMREFSQIQTIVVDANYRIVAGHARWEAAKRLGLTRVAILRVEHLSEDQLRLYAIADKRLCVMQRLHESDIAAEFIAQGDWEVLILPAIAIEREEHRYETILGPQVVIRQPGDALHPQLYGCEAAVDFDRDRRSAQLRQRMDRFTNRRSAKSESL